MLRKLVVLGVFVFSILASNLMCFADSPITNNTFDNGFMNPWHVSSKTPAKCQLKAVDEKAHVTVTANGTSYSDVQFRHTGIKMTEGLEYTAKFTVQADNDATIFAKIVDMADRSFEGWIVANGTGKPVELKANTKVTITETFKATKSGDMFGFTIYLGGDHVTSLPTTFVFDDIYLDTPNLNPTPTPIPPNNGISANQVGYYKDLTKKATMKSESKIPLDWKLLDSTDKVVLEGKTQVFGFDKDSGEHVHIIDFSDFKTTGKDYILVSGDFESYHFDISNDIYSDLKYDAIKYFYHNRSGIEIKTPYCVEERWARPAGHSPDVATAVSENGYSSDHTLDLTGGWYDAGDHGKYVVNGGISVWTMMNQYERTQHIEGAKLEPYADGKMSIPEGNNGLPDILDEAKWEMDFILKMQIPAGYPKAGMVHHKMHSIKWTSLGLAPHEDLTQRIIKPPSTAATLNLAATASQASRIWKDIDPQFSAKCLAAAELAWSEAVKNPEIYAPAMSSEGGGAYPDNYIKDDFYWAACELFATTGKDIYLEYIKNSPHFLEMPVKLAPGSTPSNIGSFDWAYTSGLGTLTLAIVPNKLSISDIERAKANIKKAADQFIAIQKKQGYGITIEPSPVGNNATGYPWASNSFVLNQCIVMAYSFDFSKDAKYLNSMTEAMDYIMGRNPLDQCYVTGYGKKPLENPHHRFFAYQAHPAYPTPPKGFISGGPNSGLEDPWVGDMLGWKPGSLPPQKCFTDNIQSWSTNEVTINWNAPFAWVTGYLDEVAPLGSQEKAKYGDLNENGTIDSVDLVILKRHLLNIPIEFNKDAADLNEDKLIDSTDFAILKRYVLEFITTLPYVE